MTNSDSAELHHNQDKAVYEKLPSDENEKPAKQNPLKLDVEIKLNDDLKESSTDVDLNKRELFPPNRQSSFVTRKCCSNEVLIFALDCDSSNRCFL